jgi:uncharacterized membrane protein
VKTADELIRTYLDELKAALKQADGATRQDALADAEEHLRTALESQKAEGEDLVESEALAAIIQEYGEPAEIAEAYLDWESGLPPALAATPAARRTAATANGTPGAKTYPGFFGVYADPRAWGGLVYMLIALVTGTVYFSWAVTGLATSLGVMVLIVGIPVTILFLLSFRGLAFLEGRLVEALLGERMPRRASFTDSSLPWVERLKILLTGKATWLSWIYLILMLPLGVIYFSVMVTLLATALGCIAAPVAAFFFNIPVMTFGTGASQWHLPEYLTPLVAVVGVLLATATMHIARFTGRIHGKFAKALLVSD